MHDVFTPSEAKSTGESLPVPDLLRSNSYSLTRGRKVISSRPWSLHDVKDISEAMKRLSSISNSQEDSSDSSNSSSSSSSSPASGDEKICIEKTLIIQKTDSNVVDPYTSVDISGELSEEGEDNVEDSDSEETENTVIARSHISLETDEPRSQIDLSNESSSPPPLKDEGDTLSSYSGEELNFEKEGDDTLKETSQEVSSPYEQCEKPENKEEEHESLSTGEDPQLSRSFEFYSTPVINYCVSNSYIDEGEENVKPNNSVKEPSIKKEEKRTNPINLGVSNEGVFCLSGTPRFDACLRKSSSVESDLEKNASLSIDLSKEKQNTELGRESVGRSKLPQPRILYPLKSESPKTDILKESIIGGKPPIPGSYQPKNFYQIRKEQQQHKETVEKQPYFINKKPIDKTSEVSSINKEGNPPVLPPRKRTTDLPKMTSPPGKNILNKTSDQSRKYHSKCLLPHSKVHDRETYSSTSSNRRSSRGHNGSSDPFDSFIRCSTPSDGGAEKEGKIDQSSKGSSGVRATKRFSLGTEFPVGNTKSGGSFLNKDEIFGRGRKTEDAEELSDDVSSSGATSEDSASVRPSGIKTKGVPTHSFTFRPFTFKYYDNSFQTFVMFSSKVYILHANSDILLC
ncbi:UNVERIFIED_CONTAM: hypothetical protein RMT77_005310 [Armadillidium vulgare]